ncbi:hypothetical protein H0H93_015724 [Arthromyces matolae]|nr:hypothetical protein H0H93_015724 [Arthromyces matolae]
MLIHNRTADAQMLYTLGTPLTPKFMIRSDGLARVKSLCEGLEGSRVLALPTRVIIDEHSLAQLNNVRLSFIYYPQRTLITFSPARGIWNEYCPHIQLYRARARALRATFKYPQGVLRVAPPGKDETYNFHTVSDLWVHTSPDNWADAVLRVAGVMAEYSCDATKTPLKEAVMRLGQKRGRNGKAKFLVLEPVIPTKYRLLVNPVPWKIEVPSNPWISIVDIRPQSARHVQYNAHSNPDIRIDNLPISQPQPPLVGLSGMKELLQDSPSRAQARVLANEDLELDGPDRKRVKRQ